MSFFYTTEMACTAAPVEDPGGAGDTFTDILRYFFLQRASSPSRHVQCRALSPRHRSGVARSGAFSLSASQCPRPTYITNTKRVLASAPHPPSTRAEQHGARQIDDHVAQKGGDRTIPKGVIALAQKGGDRLGHSRRQLAEHHRPVRARQLDLVHRCPRQVLQRAQEDAFALVWASVHEWAAHEGGRRGHVRVKQPIARDKVACGVGGEALEHRLVVDQGSQLGAEHLPLGAIRCNQVQSGTVECNHMQSCAIRFNQHGGKPAGHLHDRIAARATVRIRTRATVRIARCRRIMEPAALRLSEWCIEHEH